MAASTMRKLKLILCLAVIITVSSLVGAFSMAMYVYQYKIEYVKPVQTNKMVIPKTYRI